MRDIKSVEEEIEITRLIKSLAQTYEEVAVLKIQKVRITVLTTRDFLKRVTEVYYEVKKSYKNRVLKLISKKKKDETIINFTTLNKNGKTVTILITPNERLMGEISNKVFYSFFKKILEEKTDLIVIGKVGKDLFDSYKINRSYKYFDLPIINSSTDILKPIISDIIQYENVNVYHGKFINLVNQIEVLSSLSGEVLEESTSQQQKKNSDFLFEPSIEEILNFFEVQIFSSLFKQSIAEAELANLGSRIKAMEEVTNNTEEQIKYMLNEKQTISKAVENRKQLQRLAGISLWAS